MYQLYITRSGIIANIEDNEVKEIIDGFLREVESEGK